MTFHSFLSLWPSKHPPATMHHVGYTLVTCFPAILGSSMSHHGPCLLCTTSSKFSVQSNLPPPWSANGTTSLKMWFIILHTFPHHLISKFTIACRNATSNSIRSPFLFNSRTSLVSYIESSTPARSMTLPILHPSWGNTPYTFLSTLPCTTTHTPRA